MSDYYSEFDSDDNRCGKCRRKDDATQRSYQNQLRPLRERMETLEIQNTRLASECARLRDELRNAKFKERSTIVDHTFPALPDEILHDIFAFATHLDEGLVSPHWSIAAQGSSINVWAISSQARRTIPLVCRKWYTVGLEYLFRHIVISNHRQLSNLLDAIKANPVDMERRTNWIRGLEFILPSYISETNRKVAHNARNLIQVIPRGRLRAFGFEDGFCESQRLPRLQVSGIVLDALQHSGQFFRQMHLPCLNLTPRGGLDSFLKEFRARNVDPTTMIFPQLEFLSILHKERRLECSDTCNERVKKLFASGLPSLRTAYIGWSFSDLEDREEQGIKILSTATNLDTIYVTLHNTLTTSQVDSFLTSVPRARHLIFILSNPLRGTKASVEPDEITGTQLEEVTVVLGSRKSYTIALNALHPFFMKIKNGRFPALKRLVVRGPYAVSSMEYRDVSTDMDTRGWKTVLRSCKDNGIQFVEDHDVANYLWQTRFAVVDTRQADTTESETSFEEDQWRETNSSVFSYSTTDHERLTDFEDCRYRYVAQPDLDYDTDSEDPASDD